MARSYTLSFSHSQHGPIVNGSFLYTVFLSFSAWSYCKWLVLIRCLSLILSVVLLSLSPTAITRDKKIKQKNKNKKLLRRIGMNEHFDRITSWTSRKARTDGSGPYLQGQARRDRSGRCTIAHRNRTPRKVRKICHIYGSK